MGNIGKNSPSEFGAEQPAVYLLPLEPISETDISVYAPGMNGHKQTKNDGHYAQTIAHHCA